MDDLFHRSSRRARNVSLNLEARGLLSARQLVWLALNPWRLPALLKRSRHAAYLERGSILSRRRNNLLANEPALSVQGTDGSSGS